MLHFSHLLLHQDLNLFESLLFLFQVHRQSHLLLHPFFLYLSLYDSRFHFFFFMLFFCILIVIVICYIMVVNFILFVFPIFCCFIVSSLVICIIYCVFCCL